MPAETYKDPEKRKEYMRQYAQRPYVKAKKAEYARKHMKEYNQRDDVKTAKAKYNKEYRTRPDVIKRERKLSRLRHVKKVYGLDAEKYLAMIKDQNGKCAICGLPLNDDICVDHDHSTGEIRGLLHRRCNSGLGHFGDDITILNNAIAYLQKYSKLANRRV